jgi:hypothetical protein
MAALPKWLTRWRKPRLLAEAPPDVAPPLVPQVEIVAEPVPEPEPKPIQLPPVTVDIKPEPPAATLQPEPSQPDPQQLLEFAKARVAYFAPAGYAPFQTRSPRLIAPAEANRFQPEMAEFQMRSYLRRPADSPPSIQAQPGIIATVHPATFAAYLLSAEQDARFDVALGDLYLREQQLLQCALNLRNAALANWQSGKEAWTVGELYAQACSEMSDKPTALLLCHNVTKAFARGGEAIRWVKTDRIKGEYSDGTRTFTARRTGGTGPLPTAPSIYYLLFSPAVFGTDDPGDWPRWFGWAALAAFVGAGRAQAASGPLSAFLTAWDNLLEPASKAPAPERAWKIGAAASFAELSAYGRCAEANISAAKTQLSGLLFGLGEVQQSPPPNASWDVPYPTGTMRLDGPLTATLDSAGKAAIGADIQVKPEPLSIDAQLLDRLWLAARRSPQQTTPPVHLLLSIEEGAACRLGSGGWGDSQISSLASPFINALSPNVFEHAVRRQVILRTTRSTCEMDRGNGYESLIVLPGGEP